MTNAGEIKCYNYLTASGYNVVDTTDNPDYWYQDIDFIAEQGGEQTTIEVKWDSCIARTGNMFIELISDIDNAKDGWYKFCKADYIFYGDSKNNLFYVFKLTDLKAFISENTDLPTKKSADRALNGEIKKVGIGLLVPIRRLQKKYPVRVIKL